MPFSPSPWNVGHLNVWGKKALRLSCFKRQDHHENTWSLHMHHSKRRFWGILSWDSRCVCIAFSSTTLNLHPSIGNQLYFNCWGQDELISLFLKVYWTSEAIIYLRALLNFTNRLHALSKCCKCTQYVQSNNSYPK